MTELQENKSDASAARPQRILVQTQGSRGDMQPFLAIAFALKDAGYDVMLATNEDHMPALNKAGIKAAGVFSDTEEQLKDPRLALPMASGDLFDFVNGVAEILKEKAEDHLTRWMTMFEEYKPDFVVSGTMCEIFAIIAERHFGVPYMSATLFFVPESPLRVLGGLPQLPCCCKRWIHRYITRKMVHDAIDAFAPHTKSYGFQLENFWSVQDTYEMKFSPRFGQVCGLNARLAKVMYGPTTNIKFLGHFAVDTGKQVVATEPKHIVISKDGSGFFGDASITDTCTKFIEAGSKPVYVGFGSMTSKSPEHMVTLITKALKHAGARAIVFEGWAHMSVDILRSATSDAALVKYAEENILFVGKTPHAWLFPRCAAVIHHGGAGTTHTCLRSGTPQIITPCFIDQWDFAWFLNKSGVGVGFEKVNLANITHFPVGDAITTIVSNPSYRKRAEDWAKDANSEVGPKGVVDFVEEFWTKHVVTGDWRRHVDERVKAQGFKPLKAQ